MGKKKRALTLIFPFLQSVPRVPWSAGIKVLGCPVGSSSFIADFTTTVCNKLESSIGLLQLLGCPQSAFLLLKYCLGACKVIYLLRCLPYCAGRALALRSSTLIKSSLSYIVGVPVSELQWELCRLPIAWVGWVF